LNHVRLKARIFRNTYLVGPKWLFVVAISNDDYERVLGALEPRAGSPRSRLIPSKLRRLRNRLRPWFWPNITDAEIWASASEDGWYAPSRYIIPEPGPLLTRLLATTRPDESVLDMGCNSGANLNFLYQAGFRHLHGVDAGSQALSLFVDRFPETYACAEVKHDLFQRYLLQCPDGMVDVVHSNGATLELVHPSFPIVKQLCRVARRAVMIDIVERGHAYPRDYIAQFRSNDFELVYCDRPLDLINGSSVLHFERKVSS
jgi:SAM-dependent methyltransferase